MFENYLQRNSKSLLNEIELKDKKGSKNKNRTFREWGFLCRCPNMLILWPFPYMYAHKNDFFGLVFVKSGQIFTPNATKVEECLDFYMRTFEGYKSIIFHLAQIFIYFGFETWARLQNQKIASIHQLCIHEYSAKILKIKGVSHGENLNSALGFPWDVLEKASM